MHEPTTRLSAARQLAMDLLDDIETKGGGISSIIMKTQRLARLLRDQDAQQWLELELKGYPVDFKVSSLGACRKYPESSGRLLGTSIYCRDSLPDLEAKVAAAEQALKSSFLPSINNPINNFTAAGATEKIMKTGFQMLADCQKIYTDACRRFQSFKSGIHNYATETFIAIELGDAAEDIFQNSRILVDTFVRTHCPKAAEQLVCMNDRIKESSPESLSSALTACRRLLATVADALFPAQEGPYIDSRGKSRKVGPDAYKNRLLAFLDKKILSGSTHSVIESQMEHLASRLDAVYEKACKGVHDNVDLHEAKLTIIQTWLFLAELARFAPIDTRILEAAK